MLAYCKFTGADSFLSFPDSFFPMGTAQAINNAFANLAELSEPHYDFWLSELYNCATGEIIESRWDDANLRMMEDDVMQLSQLS